MTIAARAAHARNLVGPLMRAAYRVVVEDSECVPTQGAALLVCSWNNVATPAVLKSAVPRPVHVWAGGAAALSGGVLTLCGDLPVPESHPGISALRRALALIAEGAVVAAVGIADVGYLISRTSVPVVPVRIEGPQVRRSTDPPRWGSVVRVAFGSVRIPDSSLLSSAPTMGTTMAAAEWARQCVVDFENRVFDGAQ